MVDTTNTDINEEKIPIKCICKKKIAERDKNYIYIYCKQCKRVHKYRLADNQIL